jgi:hypothetical protein
MQWYNKYENLNKYKQKPIVPHYFQRPRVPAVPDHPEGTEVTDTVDPEPPWEYTRRMFGCLSHSMSRRRASTMHMSRPGHGGQ